jgi:hypothetical protein
MFFDNGKNYRECRRLKYKIDRRKVQYTNTYISILKGGKCTTVHSTIKKEECN